MVHYLFQTAVFKQHMLPRPKLIRRLAKLIRNIEHRRLRSAIVHARVAVSRHPKLEIKRPIAAHREAEIRRHHHIACGRGHLNFDRPAIERQHQWSGSRCGSFGTLAGRDLSPLGIPSREAYVEAYRTRTGLDPRPHLGVYLAYNFFRMAAILQGIAGRLRDGTAASESAAAMGPMVRPLATKGWEFAREAAAG